MYFLLFQCFSDTYVMIFPMICMIFQIKKLNSHVGMYFWFNSKICRSGIEPPSCDQTVQATRYSFCALCFFGCAFFSVFSFQMVSSSTLLYSSTRLSKHIPAHSFWYSHVNIKCYEFRICVPLCVSATMSKSNVWLARQHKLPA